MGNHPGDRVLTIPNALSVLRLLLLPVFGYLLFSGAVGWAVAVLMFSGFSDWADGKIARLVADQSSRLGELLDPAVDRIYMLVIPVALAVVRMEDFSVERFSPPLKRAISPVPKAPMAAASGGVKMPP